MSASDKKKLRKEQAAAQLTERQLQEQAEAKKLKLYTTIFVVAMLVVALTALTIFCVTGIKNSGIIQKSTIAATVGEHKLNSVEMGYYYNDAVSEQYNEWSTTYEDSVDAYLQAMGLDTSVALDQQTHPETDQTWAQYFLDAALENAKRDYALYDLAKAEGFTLPADKQEAVENVAHNIELYAGMYGYSNNQYMRLSYGSGATLKSYQQYYERTLIADAYAEAHNESLTYDDAALRAHEADKYDDYTSYEYTSVYLSYTAFQAGGTEDENGTTTYTDAENEAARAALKTAAEDLATATSVEELKTKVDALTVKEGATVTVNENQRSLYPVLKGANADLAAWLSDDARTEGEISAIPVTAKTTNADGAETENTNGYYVVIFHKVDENKAPMSNVRHLLVKFEEGEETEESEEPIYTDEAKTAAKEAAEAYLKEWKEGEATEESFIALLKEHSEDTGVEENEGLYEDITPDSSYVKNFLNWSVDPARKAGDTDVIETEYGYHVMYFVGHSELTYRDSMITEELRVADQEAWLTGIEEAATGEILNTGKMSLDLILNPAQ